jgi:hypothetical protein
MRRVIEAAFPGKVASFYVPALGRMRACGKQRLLDYFWRQVYDPEVWDGRVLTIYGTGAFHHFTYALTRLALERRGLGGFNWTYFHFDNHRDDYYQSYREQGQLVGHLDCGNFVDSIAFDHQGIPFFVGPDACPRQDSRGYDILGTNIPVYSSFFTKKLQRSRDWRHTRKMSDQIGVELPSIPDLRETPTESYLTFDLDILAHPEMYTDYDQNDNMTLRRMCQILDRIRRYKRVFGADILGYPEEASCHPLSLLTLVILARKIMGLGTKRLLEYHTYVKRKQAARLNRAGKNYWNSVAMYHLGRRESPISEEELLEVL